MYTRKAHKLSAFISCAEILAGLSVCKRMKVGCIVFPPDFSQISALGYNGPPVGLSHDRCSPEKDPCWCAHAETNAVINLSGPRDRKLIMYVTHAPCKRCAATIINSQRIGEVIYCRETGNEEGLADLRAAGIQVTRYAETSPQ